MHCTAGDVSKSSTFTLDFVSALELCFTVDADTSDSECDSPRSSTEDFEMSSTSGFDASFIEGGYESYDDSEMHYSDTFSDDYFIEDYCFDPLDWRAAGSPCSCHG